MAFSTKLAGAFLMLALAATLPVAAHHSVAGQFDVDKTVKLNGTVSRVDWINPHTYVYLDVKESSGSITTWKLESLPVAMMRKAGLSRQLILGEGQKVAISAHPARNGTPALGYILLMNYEDGRHYQFGRDPNDKPIFVE